MNLASWIIAAAVAVWFVWAVVRIVRNRGGCSCGGDHGQCGGSCASCRHHCGNCEK